LTLLILAPDPANRFLRCLMEGFRMTDELTKSTRERVLQTLLRQHRCTINDIARAVDINPISVRHHISRLEADGLVSSIEERHGVGRPRRYYFLTEEGVERFPTRYMRLTLRLLEQLKEHLPKQMINQLFDRMAADLVSDYAQKFELDGLAMEDRLERMKEVLTQEGFEIEWERQGDQYTIREVNCPYLHVGQNHPEVCHVDQTLISTVLAVPAEKVKCVLNGDSHCAYLVTEINPNEIPLEKIQ
jgi:DeoR family suf operon transcriptional repressor